MSASVRLWSVACVVALAGCGSDPRVDPSGTDAVSLGDTAGSGDVGGPELDGSPGEDADSGQGPDARDTGRDVDSGEETDAEEPDAEPEPTCDDEEQNGDETDVDCGGPECEACGVGDACDSGSDCDSGLCDRNVCIDARCIDGELSETETDVDCGGPNCAPCATGGACVLGSDCREGVCDDDVCAPPACDDGVSNGRETGVDCGAFCDPCPAGEGCAEDADCQSTVCEDSVCRAPSCDDTIRNGDESDVDCGGDECDPCETDQACGDGEDCDSGVCAESLCQPPTCTDTVLNGTETGIDCGGECPPCSVGATCNEGSDCDSSVCDDGVCVGPGCVDGVRNGDETDIDCGGGECGGCAIGEDCTTGDDCSTGACQAAVCVAAICGDGRVGDGEDCDDGDDNSDSLPDACRTNCDDPACGDGVRDTGEACDQGALNSATVPNACRPGCIAPRCGDGVADTGEQCDRGASNSDTAANGCRLSCRNAFCGDGVRDTGETCDTGASNSDSTPGACRLNCQPARCGDGVVDGGEDCDNGAANGFSSCSTECERIASPCDDSTADYCVILPFGQDAELDVVWEDLARPPYDLGFIFDISGSMNAAATAHRTLFTSAAFADAINRRSGTRVGLAASEGLDCGFFGDVLGVPLTVLQRMTSSLSNFQNAGGALQANGGGTEHMSEALYQYATGRGRLNVSGCTISGESTVIAPAFDPAAGLVPGVADGNLGGIGFRTNALRPTFFATDEEDTARSDDFPHGASSAEAIDALNQQGINMFGLWFDSASQPLSPSMRAWTSTSAVPPCAWNTGRPAGCAAGQCCTGEGQSSVSPVSGMCPLAYQIDTSGDDTVIARALGTAFQDALARWEAFGGINVRLRVRGDASWNSCLLQGVEATGTISSNSCTPTPVAGRVGSVGFDDGYRGVPFGADVPFSVSLANECLRPTAETIYRANLELRVGSIVLQTRTLDVIVPPRSACTGPLCAIRCGNGAVEPGEQCDDGDTNTNNGCSNSCTLNRCGDGVVNESLSSRVFINPTIAGTPNRRLCDDGASCPEGTCNVELIPDAPEHGFCQANGFARATTVVYGGGASVSNALGLRSYTCTDFVCTFVPTTVAYTCAAHEVLSSITCAGMGPEECDGTPDCDAQCLLPQCGDGVPQGTEQCDDGNDIDNDFCSNTCRTPVCGDGVIAGGESCDDGTLNANAPGACRTNCSLPRCGDGIRDASETCDDGNASNTDSCDTSCRVPGCGDGIVVAPETCDDGNSLDTDACPNTCRLPRCGDGIVQTSRGEVCDDGNANNTDGCNSSCQHAPAAVSCAFINLGSAEGVGVSTGTTVGGGNDFTPPSTCYTTIPGSHTAEDLAFLWTAPRNGTFRISSEGSNFDTVISASRIPAGSSTCPATPDVCNDDFRTSGSSTSRLQGETSITLTRGERILIIIDGYSTGSGNYRLSITR